jgi:hypothetical protein
MPDGDDRVEWAACLSLLFDGIGASYIFLDDAGIGSLAAAFTDSVQDFRDGHRCCAAEPSGGKMPPGR